MPKTNVKTIKQKIKSSKVIYFKRRVQWHHIRCFSRG